MIDALGMDWNPNENTAPEAEPMDPLVREAAAAWAQKTVQHTAPTSAQKAASAPAPKPGGYVTKTAFRQYQDGIEAAVAKFVRETVTAALARMTWRTTEAERRIAELEDRLAKLEGQDAG